MITFNEKINFSFSYKSLDHEDMILSVPSKEKRLVVRYKVTSAALGKSPGCEFRIFIVLRWVHSLYRWAIRRDF